MPAKAKKWPCRLRVGFQAQVIACASLAICAILLENEKLLFATLVLSIILLTLMLGCWAIRHFLLRTD